MDIVILRKFRDSLVEFLDNLTEQLNKYPEIKGDLITLRVFVKDQMPIVDIINSFIKHILPHKEMIKKRSDTFFIERIDKFDKIPRDSVERFKMVWRSGTFTKDDISVIWEWIDAFVKLAEKYQSIL